jgi:peptide/nickel transport system substrate-binding protein
MRKIVLAAASAVALSFALSAGASAQQPRTVRVSFNNDATTMDPHANNAFTTNALLEQIYECLPTRDKDMKLAPGLAARWEQTAPTRWRFHLREGVRWHDGSSFTADDVVFSLKRSVAPTSQYGIYVDSFADAVKIDERAVDIVTKAVDLVLPDKLTRVFILSKAWAEANRAADPQNFAQREDSYASRNAMGTGPFMFRSRTPDERTVLVRNPGHWDRNAGGNVEQFVWQPISNDATRIAALLAGDIDITNFVPPQDLDRLRREPRVKVVVGQENRTLWIGFDQSRDELLYSDVKGKNPFKDARVRQAIAHAVDVEALKTRVMRGQAVPTGSMWTHFVNGYDRALDARPALDIARARALMAEAGYPNGFQVQIDCPNGNYEQVCVALGGMLAQIGIRLNVSLQAPAVTFGKFLRQDTSMFAVNWGVPTFDAMYTMRAIMMTREKVGASSWNAGQYSNPRVDAAIEAAQSEVDAEKRRGFMREAMRLHNADVGHLPLFHMMIPWAMATRVDVPHRPDNFVIGKWIVAC